MKYFINDLEINTKEFYKKLWEASASEAKFRLDDELDLFFENYGTNHTEGAEYHRALEQRQEEVYYESLVRAADSAVEVNGTKFCMTQ